MSDPWMDEVLAKLHKEHAKSQEVQALQMLAAAVFRAFISDPCTIGRILDARLGDSDDDVELIREALVDEAFRLAREYVERAGEER